jgi:hypothetical protein
MTAQAPASIYSPGSLVRARGREWVVLNGSTQEVLRVRPISGSEDDQTLIHVGLEAEPVGEAAFPPPVAQQRTSHDGALLLRDALVLSMRRGAGPFRGFGQIAVEPRAYQLVPLLMALKLDTVRLLIADDVGIGKTIEAALIARELLDRGDIERMAVLCPPHLVDQWVTELDVHFHIRAVPVTAASAGRLERDLPTHESIFGVHPHTVVSLDYIKSDRRRADFLRACPELVIVDEAHTCAAAGPGRHQRYELLRGLSESATRHMVMLTATPHSGHEQAFYRLLGLLDASFANLESATGDERTRLRERLAGHFVQRRRPDIAEWQDGNLFPRRETKEITYKLTGEWNRFFESVLDYCATIVESAQGDECRQRLNFWGTLALLRCAASSPVAAVSALRARAGFDDDASDRDELLDRIFDGASDALPDDDVEPPARTEDTALEALIAQAEHLAGQSGDPKLKLLTDHVSQLLTDGFSPVVFCRYIATAHYLARHLEGRFKGVEVEVVTGELTAGERKEKVEQLGEAERHLLIATDCLSEGINLQEHFDAVVHYDLSWNPTRHEQREGRVDRFGQSGPVRDKDGRSIVRATLMYGANNPVDGAVLEVILRKAQKIREELGVPVPVPDEGHQLTQVLLKAVLLKRRGKANPAHAKQLEMFESSWVDIADSAKKNRTLFAQRRLKPDDVIPEWRKSLAALGGSGDVRRFTGRALARLGAGLEALSGSRGGHKAPLTALPEDVRERLEAEGLAGTVLVDFVYPPAPRCHPVQRSHPLVSVLAETLLERSLGRAEDEEASDLAVLGRVGCWVSSEVNARTLVLLLRLRHQLVTQRARASSTLLVEESGALAFSGSALTPAHESEEALSLLAPDPVGDPPGNVREREALRALERLAELRSELSAYAERRAQALLADHRRVREAAGARGSYSVKALLPPDVIGAYVLLPRV